MVKVNNIISEDIDDYGAPNTQGSVLGALFIIQGVY